MAVQAFTERLGDETRRHPTSTSSRKLSSASCSARKSLSLRAWRARSILSSARVATPVSLSFPNIHWRNSSNWMWPSQFTSTTFRIWSMLSSVQTVASRCLSTCASSWRSTTPSPLRSNLWNWSKISCLTPGLTSGASPPRSPRASPSMCRISSWISGLPMMASALGRRSTSRDIIRAAISRRCSEYSFGTGGTSAPQIFFESPEMFAASKGTCRAHIW
mmetsp:Transcript_31212/g.87928  ORF Transcript_31212/g.87928 Transcript_31212/m.87928 type:complete len:219 (-) Transcript_31212:742-1398(-)